MDQTITFHERIHKKHPDISVDDVQDAWKSRVKCQLRRGEWPPQYVALGFDRKGRALQMVAVYEPLTDGVLVFHAMRVTGNVKKELGYE